VTLFSDSEKSKKAILAARLALEKTSIGISLEEKPSDDAANSENIASDTNNVSSNEGKGGNSLPDKNNAGGNEDAKGAELTGR
jgi:hypothetical protein